MNEDFYFRQPRPIKTQHEHIEQLRKKRKEKLKIKKIKTHKTQYKKKLSRILTV